MTIDRKQSIFPKVNSIKFIIFEETSVYEMVKHFLMNLSKLEMIKTRNPTIISALALDICNNVLHTKALSQISEINLESTQNPIEFIENLKKSFLETDWMISSNKIYKNQSTIQLYLKKREI